MVVFLLRCAGQSCKLTIDFFQEHFMYVLVRIIIWEINYLIKNKGNSVLIMQ